MAVPQLIANKFNWLRIICRMLNNDIVIAVTITGLAP